jgi:hypothetical protein
MDGGQSQLVDKVGERGRNRTFNLLIKSQLLCQLSYAPFNDLQLVREARCQFWRHFVLPKTSARRSLDPEPIGFAESIGTDSNERPFMLSSLATSRTIPLHLQN